MTDTEIVAKLRSIRAAWATDSNKTTDQPTLFTLGDQAIAEIDEALYDGHPDPPPPRIHP